MRRNVIVRSPGRAVSLGSGAPVGVSASMSAGVAMGVVAASGSGITGTVADGESITISALSGESFGATGPTLAFLEYFSDNIVGNAGFDGSQPIGTLAKTSTSPMVSNADMPLGKGVQMRSDGFIGRADISFGGDYTEVFLSAYEWITWDASNGKIFWVLHDDDNSSAKPDFWFPSFNTGPQYTIASNDTELSTFDTGSWSFSDSVAQRISVWAKAGPDVKSAVGADGMFQNMDAVAGIVKQADYADYKQWHGDSTTEVGWNRVNVVGYSSGEGASLDVQFGQIYIAVGSGAAARVEFTDAETYSSSKKGVMAQVTAWADGEITATVHAGMIESFSGAYMHIFDANNDHTNGGTGRLIS